MKRFALEKCGPHSKSPFEPIPTMQCGRYVVVVCKGRGEGGGGIHPALQIVAYYGQCCDLQEVGGFLEELGLRFDNCRKW